MSGPYEHNFTMFGFSEYAISETDLTPLKYNNVGSIQFPRALENTMGFGIHRSGWTDCIRALSQIESVHPIDDFVEQTFLARQALFYHDTPFVGFFHYPPDDDLPSFVHPHHDIRFAQMFRTHAWRRSVQHLKLAFTFSQHLADWLSTKIEAPVISLKHPTNLEVREWNPNEFRSNPRIVQIGSFYRDTRAIYRLSTTIPKLRLLDLRYDWILKWDELVGAYVGPETSESDVFHLDRVSSEDYDELLSSSIVMTKFMALSASNAIVECISRNTPLIINRSPAAIEYLGQGYPFFDISDETSDAELVERAMVAHKYLKKMDKTWLSHDTFIHKVRSSLQLA